MPGIIVDIGTGDGSFVREIAKSNPDRFIIGIDPDHAGLIDVSRKLEKKPEKGGLPNALFVLSDVVNLPEGLNGLANQVFINLPWGSLLQNIILAEPQTWKSIKRICTDGAIIDILTGYDTTREVKDVAADLPDLTDDYIKNEFKLKIKELGFELVETETLSSKNLKNYPSTWAKKLSYALERNFTHIRLHVVKSRLS